MGVRSEREWGRGTYIVLDIVTDQQRHFLNLHVQIPVRGATVHIFGVLHGFTKWGEEFVSQCLGDGDSLSRIKFDHLLQEINSRGGRTFEEQTQVLEEESGEFGY